MFVTQYTVPLKNIVAVPWKLFTAKNKHSSGQSMNRLTAISMSRYLCILVRYLQTNFLPLSPSASWASLKGAGPQILTVPSSEALAMSPGSTGFQLTQFTVRVWPVSSAMGSSLRLCQMYTLWSTDKEDYTNTPSITWARGNDNEC